MKIKQYFERAEDLINEMIIAIQAMAKADNQQAPLVVCDNFATFNKIFGRYQADRRKSSGKKTTRISDYLNNLYGELQRSRNPLFHYERRGCLFLNVHPIRLCYSGDWTKESLLESMQLLLSHLQLQREQLLHGWQIKEDGDTQQVCNSSKGTNWEIFWQLIDAIPEQPTDGQPLKIQLHLSHNLYGNLYKRIAATLGYREFLFLNSEHDFTDPYARRFRATVQAFSTQHIDSANPVDAQIAKLLKFILETCPPSTLFAQVSKIPLRFQNPVNKPPSYLGPLKVLLALHDNEKNFPIPPIDDRKQLMRAEELIDKVSKIITPAVCELKEGFKKALPNNVFNLMEQVEEPISGIISIIRSLPTLSHPYDGEIDQFYADHVINLASFIKPFQSILSYVSANLNNQSQVESIAKWLLLINTAFSNEAIEIFQKRNYHTATKMLAKPIVDLCETILKAPSTTKDPKIVSALYTTRTYLFSSHIESGHFEAAQFFLETYDKHPIDFHTDYIIQFLLQHCESQLNHAVLQLRLGNLENAFEHLNDAKKHCDTSTAQFRRLGQSEQLTPFIVTLRSMRRRIGILYQFLALGFAKRGEYDQAIQLSDIANQLFSFKLIQESISLILHKNNKISESDIDIDQIIDYYNDTDQAIDSLSEKLSLKKSIATCKRSNNMTRPRVKLLSSKKSVGIDPYLIKLRCLQAYCLETLRGSYIENYQDSIFRVTLFYEQELPVQIKDQTIKMLVELFCGYATTMLTIANKNAAIKTLSSAEYYAQQVSEQKSLIAKENSLEIAETKAILTRYLTKIDYYETQNSLNEIKELTLHDSADPFSCFICYDPNLLVKIYPRIMKMDKDIAPCMITATELLKKLPPLVYEVAALRLRITYEAYTQMCINDGASLPHLATFEDLAAAHENFKLHLNNQRIELSPELESFLFLVESIRANHDMNPTKALSILSHAEKSAAKTDNIIHALAINVQKIRVLCQYMPDDLHTQLHKVFSTIIASANKNRTSLNPLLIEFTKPICSMIFNIYTLCRANQLVKGKESHPKALIELRPLFTLRIQLFEVMIEILKNVDATSHSDQSQYCEKLYEEALTDLESLDDLQESALRQRIFKDNNLLIIQYRKALLLLPYNELGLFEANSPAFKVIALRASLLDYQPSSRLYSSQLADFALLKEQYTAAVQCALPHIIQHIFPQLPTFLKTADNQKIDINGLPLWLTQLTQVITAIQNANQLKSKKVPIELLPILVSLIEECPQNSQLLFTAVKAYCLQTLKSEKNEQLLSYLNRAVALNCPNARYLYARVLQKGHYGETVQLQKAQALLNSLSEEEFYRAPLRLARWYKQGFFGIPKCDDLAEKFARIAKNCPGISQEIKQEIDDQFDLDLYIPAQEYESDEEYRP